MPIRTPAARIEPPADLPFYLGLADDDCIQIGVEDDEGVPRALLETATESIRVWGDVPGPPFGSPQEPFAEF